MFVLVGKTPLDENAIAMDGHSSSGLICWVFPLGFAQEKIPKEKLDLKKTKPKKSLYILVVNYSIKNFKFLPFQILTHVLVNANCTTASLSCFGVTYWR